MSDETDPEPGVKPNPVWPMNEADGSLPDGKRKQGCWGCDMAFRRPGVRCAQHGYIVIRVQP